MKLRRGVFASALAALAIATPASALQWLANAGPPAITIDVTIGPTDATGATVTYAVKSHLTPELVVTCTPEGAGTQFSVTTHFNFGTTTISCSDTAGNLAEQAVTISPPTTTETTTTTPTSTDTTTSTDVTTTTDPTTTTDSTTTTTTTSPSDTSGPEFSNFGAITVQANGPGGSVVNYTPPTATDAVDGPALVTCTPPPGSQFPLGTTTVSCSASDSHGNSSGVTFSLNVVDTVPPTLFVPDSSTAVAENSEGLWANGYGAAQFLAAAHAVDLVDPNPRVTNNAPERFSIGVHTLTFTATDASGNNVSRTSTLVVLPVPPPGTPPPALPTVPAAPPNVTSFKATAGDARVQLSWQIPTAVDHVVIRRSLTAGGDAQQIYSGTGKSYLDRGVANGLEYRYVIVSVSNNGESAGVAATALPKRNFLRAPKEAAKLKRPPKLVWLKNSEASYYNVQLFRGSTKILSTWPVRPVLTLKRAWKYDGRRYTLARGTYRWYVWPGFGARANVDYGELMGSRSFQITR